MAKKRFNISERNDCILPEVLIELEDFSDWGTEIPKRVAYFNESKDERNGVTYLALFVEQELFRMLKIIFPAAPQYLSNLNFSGSINYIRAFKIIPDHILEATKCVKDIRNEFAHNIEILKIEDLNEKLLSKLNYFIESYEGDYDYVEIDDTFLNRYKTICMNIVAALRIYEPSIKLVRGTLDSGNFNPGSVP